MVVRHRIPSKPQNNAQIAQRKRELSALRKQQRVDAEAKKANLFVVRKEVKTDE